MKIINNTALFNRLQTISKLVKDSNGWEKEVWLGLFDNQCRLIDEDVPVFVGGLDNIEETRNQFIFHDIGCNGKDNSFIVRRD